MPKPLTRKELHAELDQALDRWGYEEEIPIAFGRITLDVQIEHNEVTARVAERELTRKRQRQN